MVCLGSRSNHGIVIIEPRDEIHPSASPEGEPSPEDVIAAVGSRSDDEMQTDS